MKKGFYILLSGALLLGLLWRCGEAGPAVYGEVFPRATDSNAERAGTPSEADREEREDEDEEVFEDEYEDEVWDQWEDVDMFPATQASPSEGVVYEASPSVAVYEASPSEAAGRPGSCSTPSELCSLLEAGESFIQLTGEIELEPGQKFSVKTEEDIYVDMNGYGITVPGGARLAIEGPVRFEGSADSRGLFRVSGQLELRLGVEIRAEGTDAVGLHFFDIVRSNSALRTNEVRVEVSGTGSTGIWWQDSSGFFNDDFCIVAEGADSVGIRSDSGAELRRCQVRADGMSVIAGGEIKADLAFLEPEPQGAQVIHRETKENIRLAENGWSVAAGTDIQEFYRSLPPWTSYTYYDVDGEVSSVSVDLPVTWENLPEDISRPGTYSMICRPGRIPGWMAAPPPEFEVPVHVVGAEQPHIKEVFRMGKSLAFVYFSKIIGADQVSLLCSMDGGETWRDVLAVPGYIARVEPTKAVLDKIELNHQYMFKLSVTGGPMEGESIAVPFSFYEHDMDRYGNGDRDGDGRGDQGEELPDNGSNSVPDGDNSQPSGGGNAPEPGTDNSRPSGGGNAMDPGTDNSRPSGGGNATEPGTDNSRPSGGGNATEPGTDNSQPSGGGNATEPGTDNSQPSGGGNATDPGTDNSQPPGGGSTTVPVTGEPQPSGGETTPPSEADILLSKAMLVDQLEANPKSVTFLGDGIRAVVPADGLRELELAEKEQFAVRLRIMSKNQFEVRFWAGRRELTGFGDSGFTVDLEYAAGAGNGGLLCRAVDNTAVPVVYRDQRAWISLKEGGIYTIVPEETAPVSPGENEIYVVAASALLLFMIAFN